MGDGSEADIIEVLHLLLGAGCDIDALDHLGRTALFGWNNFSYDKHQLGEAFVSSLLCRGARPTVLDATGASVLHAMKGNQKERNSVKLLIDAGADINLARNSDGQTPLINATRTFQLMDPTMFHDLKADFDRQDHDGNTAFHYACASWCMEANHATIWLSFSDPSIQNNAGRLPMTYFVWGNGGQGRVDAIGKMVEMGMDLETRDNLGRTPLLHFFCNGRHHGNEHFIKEMLNLGADSTAKDFKGKSGM